MIEIEESIISWISVLNRVLTPTWIMRTRDGGIDRDDANDAVKWVVNHVMTAAGSLGEYRHRRRSANVVKSQCP